MNNTKVEFDEVEYRRRWRIWWLHALLSLADIELQQRWLDKRISNPHYRFSEFINKYFDDLMLNDGYEQKIHEGYVTQEEYDCIKDFHSALDGYQEPDYASENHYLAYGYSPSYILNDPAWLAITSLGKTSLEKLRDIIQLPEEQNIFDSKSYFRPLRSGDFTWPKHPKQLRLKLGLLLAMGALFWIAFSYLFLPGPNFYFPIPQWFSLLILLLIGSIFFSHELELWRVSLVTTSSLVRYFVLLLMVTSSYPLPIIYLISTVVNYYVGI